MSFDAAPEDFVNLSNYVQELKENGSIDLNWQSFRDAQAEDAEAYIEEQFGLIYDDQ